jgi:hypothetical protein
VEVSYRERCRSMRQREPQADFADSLSNDGKDRPGAAGACSRPRRPVAASLNRADLHPLPYLEGDVRPLGSGQPPSWWPLPHPHNSRPLTETRR